MSSGVTKLSNQSEGGCNAEALRCVSRYRRRVAHYWRFGTSSRKGWRDTTFRTARSYVRKHRLYEQQWQHQEHQHYASYDVRPDDPVWTERRELREMETLGRA